MQFARGQDQQEPLAHGLGALALGAKQLAGGEFLELPHAG
jgi:hypothetical protein